MMGEVDVEAAIREWKKEQEKPVLLVEATWASDNEDTYVPASQVIAMHEAQKAGLGKYHYGPLIPSEIATLRRQNAEQMTTIARLEAERDEAVSAYNACRLHNEMLRSSLDKAFERIAELKKPTALVAPDPIHRALRIREAW